MEQVFALTVVAEAEVIKAEPATSATPVEEVETEE